MREYRVKKKFGKGLKPGDILKYKKINGKVYYGLKDNWLEKDIVENCPYFFELVEKVAIKWWTPDKGEGYYYLHYDGSVSEFINEERWDVEGFRFNFGNVFKSLQLVEKASSGLRDWLEQFHKDNKA